MAPQSAVLEETPPLRRRAVALGAHRTADMIDDAEACAPDDRGFGHAVGCGGGEMQTGFLIFVGIALAGMALGRGVPPLGSAKSRKQKMSAQRGRTVLY